MSACQIKKTDVTALLSGDLEEERRKAVTEHLKECRECRKDVEELRRVFEEADAVKGEIREALGSVDWQALPDRITDYVFAQAVAPEKRLSAGERFRAWLFQARMRPVLAGVVMGVVLGSFGMYMALRRPAPRPEAGFQASGEFLDKVELEMARRETVDYLEKSQYVLLDCFGPAPGRAAGGSAFNTAQAKELLSKKKYLNPQLDKLRMAKARVICDQIEMLFLELAQVGDGLPQAELAKIRSFVEDRQLFLKINLIKRELQNGV